MLTEPGPCPLRCRLPAARAGAGSELRGLESVPLGLPWWLMLRMMDCVAVPAPGCAKVARSASPPPGGPSTSERLQRAVRGLSRQKAVSSHPHGTPTPTPARLAPAGALLCLGRPHWAHRAPPNAAPPLGPGCCLSLAPHPVLLPAARATLEILIPDFVKQTSEEKPRDSEELEVSAGLPLALGRGCLPVSAGRGRPPSRSPSPSLAVGVRNCVCRTEWKSRCAEGCAVDELSRQRLQKLDCSLC